MGRQGMKSRSASSRAWVAGCVLIAVSLAVGVSAQSYRSSLGLQRRRHTVAARNLSESYGSAAVSNSPKSISRSGGGQMPNLNDNGVLMSPGEQALVMGALGPDKKLLEYGSGGSTKYYYQFVDKYYTIEHSQGFYDFLKPDLDALPNVVSIVEPVEKGYNGWPGGMESGNYEQFHKYVHAVDRLGVDFFDVVIVDGRARLACAVNALKYLHKDSVVFVHDYYGGEPGTAGVNSKGRRFSRQYIQLLMFFDEVGHADTIVKLQPKPDALRLAHYIDLNALYAWQTDAERAIDRSTFNKMHANGDL